jgi:hypothetical protein
LRRYRTVPSALATTNTPITLPGPVLLREVEVVLPLEVAVEVEVLEPEELVALGIDSVELPPLPAELPTGDCDV